MAGIDATAHVRVYQSDRSASAWAGYLDGHPEFDIEPDVDEGERNEAEYGPLKFLYVWLRRAGAEDAPRSGLARLRIDEDGSRLEVLAMVYVHQDFVRLESVGKILMGWTVDRWEAVIAPGLKVESSRVEDFEEREFSEREPVRNNSALLKNFEEGHYKDLIDHVVPALRDMSPRQASESADAEMGGVLTRWAKSMIQNLAEKEARHGFVPHVFWFFEELGLEHLWPRDWPQGR